MKRYCFICTAVLLLSAGCNKNMPENADGNDPVTITLKAVVESEKEQDYVSKVGASVNTDTRKVAFSWTTGDAVGVRTTAGFESFVLSGSGGGESGSFTGTPAGTVADLAVFPAFLSPSVSGTSLTVNLPAQYTHQAGQTNALLWAAVSGDRMRFRHLGGILRVTYTNAVCATRFVLSTPGKKINGAYTVDVSQGTPQLNLQNTANEAESRVAVNFPPENKEITMYIPLPVGEYPQFNVWLEDASGAVISGSVKSTSGAKVVSRKGLKDMPVLNVHYDSFQFNSLAEVSGFVPLYNDDELYALSDSDIAAMKQIIQNITINDPGCTLTEHQLSFIKLRVGRLLGDFVVVGTQLTSNENLFKVLDNRYTGFRPEGSVVFRNCPSLFNLNGMETWTSVGGDLVFENCPNIFGENCLYGLKSIQEIKGDFKIVGAQTYMFGGNFLALKKVGGDFHFEGCNGDFWNFDTMTLEEIGGDLIIKDNANVNCLKGFESIRSIGGKVIITGNGYGSQGVGGITNPGTGNKVPGFELVQEWINKGIVAKEDVTCTDSQGNPVIFN